MLVAMFMRAGLLRRDEKSIPPMLSPPMFGMPGIPPFGASPCTTSHPICPQFTAHQQMLGQRYSLVDGNLDQKHYEQEGCALKSRGYRAKIQEGGEGCVCGGGGGEPVVTPSQAPSWWDLTGCFPKGGVWQYHQVGPSVGPPSQVPGGTQSGGASGPPPPCTDTVHIVTALSSRVDKTAGLEIRLFFCFSQKVTLRNSLRGSFHF